MTAKERAESLNFGGLLKHHVTEWYRRIKSYEKIKVRAVYRQIASDLHITTDTLYKYARNEAIPSLDYAFRIAQCLDFSLDELRLYAEAGMKPGRLMGHPPVSVLSNLKGMPSDADALAKAYQKQLLDLLETYCRLTKGDDRDGLLKEICYTYAKEKLELDPAYLELTHPELRKQLDELIVQQEQLLRQVCDTWNSTLQVLSGYQKQLDLNEELTLDLEPLDLVEFEESLARMQKDGDAQQ